MITAMEPNIMADSIELEEYALKEMLANKDFLNVLF